MKTPESTTQINDTQYQGLVNQGFHGERALEVKNGKDWAWVKEFLLGAMQDQAINTLKNAKSEEERLKAQQMFLASDKPIQLLDFLISQGDAARATLAELTATLNGAGEKDNGE